MLIVCKIFSLRLGSNTFPSTTISFPFYTPSPRLIATQNEKRIVRNHEAAGSLERCGAWPLDKHEQLLMNLQSCCPFAFGSPPPLPIACHLIIFQFAPQREAENASISALFTFDTCVARQIGTGKQKNKRAAGNWDEREWIGLLPGRGTEVEDEMREKKQFRVMVIFQNCSRS